MRSFRSRSVIVLALSLAVGACTRSTAADRGGSPQRAGSSTLPGVSFPLTIADDDGVPVTLETAPRRIITFAPSATEIVFALGLGERLVGVSGPYDDHPPAARDIPEVGGAGDFGVDPNIETVLSLDPDLMLTIAGGDQWKSRLRELGVPVFTVDATGLDDLLHDIGTVGRLTGAVAAADALTARMGEQERRIEAAVAGEAPVSCFFEVYYPPLTTVGPGTFIDDMLRRAGCDSVSSAARTDYPDWSIDDLVREPPDVYLVSSESGADPAAVAKRPGFDAIAAVAAGSVVPIDSDLVSRPGPRIVDGLRLLAEALHPEAFP